MFPQLLYVYVGLGLCAVALLLLPFRAGRRLLLASLPAVAFFALLAGTAEVSFRLGLARGGGSVAASTTYTCSMHPQVRQEQPGQCPICHMELVPLGAAAAGGSGNEVIIDPVLVQNMGVRTTVVAEGRLVQSLRAFGELRGIDNRQHDVALKVQGYVERLFADTLGMRIAKDDPLFELYSPQLLVAQEELLAAQRAGSGELLAAARRKLERWDVPTATIDAVLQTGKVSPTVVFRSPCAGVLVQKDLVAGAPAMMSQTLLRLDDQSRLWLEARLPESSLGQVALGTVAGFTLEAAPGQERTGTVVFVAPSVDADSRTGAVRLEVDNQDLALKPGMFARVQFRRELPPALLLPEDAVLDTGVRQLAYQAHADGHFEPRQLRLGERGDGGMVQVLAGVQAGERVVTSGQFLIDAESRLRGNMPKLTGDDLMHQPVVVVPLDAKAQAAVDAVLAAYLRVTTAFAQDRDDLEGWRQLQAAGAALPAALPPSLAAVATAVHQALQRDGTDLPGRRKLLEPASDALIALFERARPSPSFGPQLRVMYCPMRPARWLQQQPDLRNPYYGAEMLECGEEKARLPLQPKAGSGTETRR